MQRTVVGTGANAPRIFALSLVVQSVFLFSSFASYEFAEVVYHQFGTSESALFAGNIAAGEDVNGDGYPDYVVSDPGHISGVDRGRALIYSGKSGGLIGEIKEGCQSPSGHTCAFGYGKNVAFLGDLTGDGKSELAIVGSKMRASNVIDIVEANGNRLARIEDQETISNPHVAWGFFTYFLALGNEIKNLGDVNGDGINDFVISAVDYSFSLKTGGATVGPSTGYGSGGGTGGGFPPPPPMPPTPPYPGQLRVYSGDFTNGPQELWRVERPHSDEWDRFGKSIAPIGDLDGDSVVDLVVGAYGAETGYVKVLSGATGTEIFSLQSSDDNDQFGFAVANVGDYDGDDIDDFVVGSPLSNLGCSSFQNPCDGAGRIDIYSGADADFLFGGSGSEFGGDLFNASRFGSAIASYPPKGWNNGERVILDSDQDGVAELIIGAPGFEVFPGKLDTGAIVNVNPVSWNTDFTAQGIPGFPPMEDWLAHEYDELGKTVVYLGPGIGNSSPQFVAGSPSDHEELAGEVIQAGSIAVMNYGDPYAPLLVDRKKLSIEQINSSGEQSAQLTLHAGTQHAGKSYFVFGSASGTQPGTPIYAGMTLPLNSAGDPYFEFSQWHANTESLENTVGTLDEFGTATARVKVFNPIDPVLSGLELDFAFVVFDEQSGLVLDVSNPARLVFEN